MGKQGGKGKGKHMYQVDITRAFRREWHGSTVTSLLSHFRSEI